MTADLTRSVAGRPDAVRASTEQILTEVLVDLVDPDRIAPEDHFFDDLGADSLVMAHFCARVRNRTDLPPVTIRDVYRHSTIAGLAAALDAATPASEPSAAPATSAPATEPPAPPTTPPAAAPIRTWHYVRTGALQAVAVIGYVYVVALVVVQAYEWIVAGSGLVDSYLRSVLFGGAAFLGMCLLPILAKWGLVGRWQPTRIRLWSLAYVRFWVVKTLIQRSPAVLFAGTPLYGLYLRALGAKVGRGVAIFSRNVPVCTDLLTIGDDAVVRPAAYFGCYRATAGEIETGPISLGSGSFVGEASVLDIDTALADHAQLAHASALHAGQQVPAGEHRHGSPAGPTDADYRFVAPTRCGSVRRAAYSVAQLLKVIAVQVPVLAGVVLLLIEAIPWPRVVTSGELYRDALVVSSVVFVGATLVGLLVVSTVPRLLHLAIRPGRVYPLYGLHYGLHRAIARLTNVRFFTYLFGDSAAIVHYFRGIGYGLTPVEQTGSNFGLETRHENPYLSSVGTGTMVADGLAILNADYSSTSFRLSQTTIGTRNFVGNYVVYPAQGRTGGDCLLATKVLVPVDGEVREGVGLLGSPSFEIPRSVQRDRSFDHLRTGVEFRRRLAAKTRHNAGTMALFLLTQWLFLLGVTLIALAAGSLYGALGEVALAGASVASLVFGIAYFAVVERAAGGFRALQPRYCSIYEPYFWWHERYWKLSTQPRILDGTPFKGLVWRLLGVRIGARVFDDGCVVMEKTLVTIGDDAVLNAGSIIQPHSQEDGTFKSDRISIGSGCALGVGSLVHYGVTMGDAATLAPDSFLMKGTDVPPRTPWGGNPARELQASEGSRR
jgi:non-ribosomal peptide synthetase-like protein